MNIIVCVKQIIDPEIPASAFKIDTNAKKAIPPNDKPMVISDYDANAVEAALRLKDKHGGKVSVLSLGRDNIRKVILRCLAMGCDEGFLLNDPLFDESDSFATAHALAEAIKKIGSYDLILCGRQEGDWDAGQVGPGIAELLSLPVVTMVAQIRVSGQKAMVERIAEDGRDVLEVPLPALLTITSEIGEPRYATIKGIMNSKKKKLTYWNSKDISVEQARNKILEMFIPVHEGKCEFIDADSPEEKGVSLAIKLREEKII